MRTRIANMVDQLSSKDQMQVLELLTLMVQEKQGNDSGVSLVVYQDHQACYHGDSMSAALSIYTPLLAQAVDQLKRIGKASNELVFFCIYADCRVSILGEVSA